MKFISLFTAALLCAGPLLADETKPTASFTWETSGSCTVKCDSSDGKPTATRTNTSIRGVIVFEEVTEI